jgi:hypothetical protein
MRRFFTVLIALGAVVGLVGCGGSGIDTKGVSNPGIASLVDEIVSDASFPGTRAQAECFVNYILDNTSLTVEYLSEGPSDEYGEDEEELNELMAAYIVAAQTCDIAMDFFGE